MTTPPSVQRVKKSFPADMVFDILLRLPPKSLDRFRCVSEYWNNHISDPCFREKYDIMSKNRVNIVFHRRPVIHNLNMRNQMVFEEWGSFNTKTRTFGNILTTCDVKVSHLKMVTPQGLVCFVGFKNNYYNVFLYSLTSHLFLALPRSSQSGFYLGPIVNFGIGYIPSTKKFKIVLWFIRNTETHEPFPYYNFQVIEINNTITRDGNGTRFSQWRLIDMPVNDLVNNFENPVNVECTLHWKTRHNDSIISFNLETERFREIMFPTSVYYDLSVSAPNALLHLVDLQGKLGFLNIMDPSNEDACIWRLLPHGDDDDILINWEKIYTFSLGGSFAFEPLRPLFFQGEEIVLHSTDYVMFYNLEKGSFKIVRITSDEPSDEPVNCSVVGTFYETLSNE